MASRELGSLVMGLSWLLVLAAPEPGVVDTASLKQIANVSYAVDNTNPIIMASIFSPRMDFEQWKPLTGRGDPLRNDPTYDYEPPVLERVHYWADEARLEREHFPERKSEVLVLGVSSRKPSVGPRQPPPPRRHYRPLPSKYEDYSYRLNDNFPMTILVPPPPPPPGHKPSLYVLNDKHASSTVSHLRETDPPKSMKETTSTPEHLTSLYALQESNLIYQSSTTSHNWMYDSNQTPPLPNKGVSSDYAGWGPTTPLDDIEAANDTHNFIFNDHVEMSKQPYSFYKPMLSEAPPPPRVTSNPLLLPTFLPTALPTLQPTYTAAAQTTVAESHTTWLPERTTTEASTYTIHYNDDTTTDKNTLSEFQTTPTGFPSSQPNTNILLDMISPMFTMPLVNGPDRPQDHLYAHASDNLHVYKEQQTEDIKSLESMQTMQPPPVEHTDTTPTSHKQLFHVNTHVPNAIMHKTPSVYTHDPYMHMRLTTPMPTVASSVLLETSKPTTEAPSAPMYLIIQGHSKVKTYGSKPKPADETDTINNEIPKPTGTNEVKHLHPIKEKYSSQKTEKGEIRRNRAKNLKSLVDEGRGSIEIQETDLGIKYDVSDGSDVPVEIYRKGIVDNDDENNYSQMKKTKKRSRRQLPVSIDEVLPFDEEKLESYVYNYLKGRQNSTGLTGLLSNVVTGSVSSLLDDISEEDDDDEDDTEDDDEQR